MKMKQISILVLVAFNFAAIGWGASTIWRLSDNVDELYSMVDSLRRATDENSSAIARTQESISAMREDGDGISEQGQDALVKSDWRARFDELDRKVRSEAAAQAQSGAAALASPEKKK